jgi:hypothetical protein
MRRFRSIVTIAYSRALSTIRRRRSSDSRSSCSASRLALTSRTIAIAAVAAQVALLHLERRAVGGEPREGGAVALEIVGVHEREHRRAEQRVDAAADDLAVAHVGERDASGQVEVDDAGRGLVDDRAKERLRRAQRFADAALLADVDEGEHDAADPVVAAAVRAQARQQPALAEAHLALDRHQAGEDRLRVVVELRVVEPVGEVADRPADVGGDEGEELHRRRREERDAQLAVEKDGGDGGRRHQVLQVAVGTAQLVDPALQLLVDGHQLLVDRLVSSSSVAERSSLFIACSSSLLAFSSCAAVVPCSVASRRCHLSSSTCCCRRRT